MERLVDRLAAFFAAHRRLHPDLDELGHVFGQQPQPTGHHRRDCDRPFGIGEGEHWIQRGPHGVRAAECCVDGAATQLSSRSVCQRLMSAARVSRPAISWFTR